MLRVVVADDERPARSKLRRYLAAEASVEVVGEASGGRAAVELVRTERPNLLFLDVQMPDLDGFGVVEQLGHEAPFVVFVTAHDRYAVRAFEVHALDYLLKPVGPDRFARMLARVRREVERGAVDDMAERLARLVDGARGGSRYPERILVQVGERGLPLEVSRIDRVEADRNYVELFAGPDVFRMRGTLEGLAKRLDPARFVRVNRSTIVRVEAIKEVQPWFHGEYRIVLGDGTRVSWTRTHLDRAAEVFLKDF